MSDVPAVSPKPADRGQRRGPGPGGKRRGGRQLVFTVDRTERLTPHLVRVHLGGEAFSAFVEAADPEKLQTTDKYVKMMFPPRGSSLTPPYDLDALRETLPLSELPVRRTYTVRHVDRESQTLAIDFVVHGDDGVAGPWAASARPGDRVAFSGPGGGYRPAPGSDVFHLLLGDDSAIPAVTAALEALGDDARGMALIEVDSAADELPVTVPTGVELRWLHRSDGERLAESVGGLAVPTGETSVFAHGEREAMKALRGILHDGWGLERRAMSLSAYWAEGRAEDDFQAEKREPVGQIFAD